MGTVSNLTSNQNRLAGIASIAVGGINYLLSGELSWSDFDFKRETLKGQDKVHGYSEMPEAPFIAMTLRDTNGLTVKDFNNMTNANISIAQANGKNIIGSGMWCVSAGEVKSTEATFEIRFEGKQGSVIEN